MQSKYEVKIVSILMKIYPLLYLIILCCISVFFAMMEVDNPSFIEISTWTFIAVIYMSLRMHGDYHFEQNHLSGLYLLIMASVLISLILTKRDYKYVKLYKINLEKIYMFYYIKYIPSLTIAVIIWQTYHPPEVEWFMWATISVLNVDFAQAKTKMYQRVIGGMIGCIGGMAIMPFIPPSEVLTYVFYILILMSFRLFYKYLYCYTFRCFLIVLFSGIEFQHNGETRILSIIIGGFVGLACSWLIVQGNTYLQNKITHS